VRVALDEVVTCGWRDSIVERAGAKVLERVPGTCVRIYLEEDAILYFGDAATVQFSGRCGREPFVRHDLIALERRLSDLLPRHLFADSDPRVNSKYLEDALKRELPEARTSLMYALSQIQLQRHATRDGQQIPRYVRKLYRRDLESPPPDPRILAQTDSVDVSILHDMLSRGASILPHGNFCTPEIAGAGLTNVHAYLRAIKKAFDDHGAPPDTTVHLDLYGVVGDLCGGSVERILDVLIEFSKAVHPHPLQVESPIICASQAEQYSTMARLKDLLDRHEPSITLIIDEWCNDLDDIRTAVDVGAAHIAQIKVPDLGSIFNSIEALLHCKSAGVRTYLGGTSNETVQSSAISYAATIPFGPDQILAKPSMSAAVAISLCRSAIQETRRILDVTRGSFLC
jgi:methylaspartate ammonia-lyase